MKRLFALLLMLAAIACLSGTAEAKRWWGGPSTGGGETHDSSLAEVPIATMTHLGAGNRLLWYNTPDDGGVKWWKYPIQNDTVTFTGKVITAFDAKPTTFGFWIEEPAGGPYSGVLVYTGTDNSQTAIPGLVVGDIVNVTGIFAKFPSSNLYAVNEVNTGAAVNASFGLRVTKTGHTLPPAAQKIRPGDIAQGGGVNSPTNDIFQDSLCAEQWEGVLCRMDSVFIEKKYNTNGSGVVILEANLREIVNRGTACRTAANDTCRIDDKLIVVSSDSNSVPWNTGNQMSRVYGIVSQEFGAYKLWPRDWLNGSDVVFIGAPPPPGLARAYAKDATHVVAVFDTKMDDTTAQQTNKYSLQLGVTISAAVLSADSLSVTLTTSAMTGASAQKLQVNGVRSAGFPHSTMVGTESRSFRGGITPINFVQTPKSPGLPTQDSSQVTAEVVTVRGIVTGDLGSGEIYIQDASGTTYQGVEVFGSPINLDQGDDVTIAGIIAEFTPSGSPRPKTEFSPVYYAFKNATGQAVPAPTVVTVPDLANPGDGDNGNAEKYESVLVKVSGFVYADTCADQGRNWWLHAGTPPVGQDSVPIGHIMPYLYQPCPGDNVTVIGIHGVYGPGANTNIPGGFRLQPRATLDLYDNNTSGVGNGTVRFALKQSRPNPFSRIAEIRYALSRSGPASLKIYTVGGREVRTLFNGEGKAGEYTASWDGRDQSGRMTGSGVYYYRLSQNGETLTRKLVFSH